MMALGSERNSAVNVGGTEPQEAMSPRNKLWAAFFLWLAVMVAVVLYAVVTSPLLSGT